MKNVRTCVMIFLLLTALTGFVYPAAVTLVAEAAFPGKSSGSLIVEGGEVRGSSLIGQRFSRAGYFRPRPSVSDYSAMPSGASNLGATSAAQKKLVEQRKAELSGMVKGKIPADLLLASGSGLDPHISPEAAFAQVNAVAAARDLYGRRRAELVELVKKHIEGPQYGIFGAPRVNVLLLNMDADKAFGRIHHGGE